MRCPACAQVYRGDARHLVRAGLEGGKGVSEAVAGNPAVFLTLTAPSFGALHTIRTAGDCHSGQGRRRCVHDHPNVCTQRHRSSDEMVGTPLCPDCYDYAGAVLHNASTPELWRRTTIYLARQLASALGVSQTVTARRMRLSFCRVAEFQRRGVVHLHAVVRADGPEGASPPIGVEQLAEACAAAARSVSVSHSRGTARWGKEMDVQILGHGDERAAKVATYVAKYATKSSSEDPRLDGRIASLQDLEARALPAHLHQMAATALKLTPNRHSVICTWPVMPTAWGSAGTSSPSPGATRPPLPPCGRPGRNGTRPDATAVRYPKTGLPRATGGRSVPAGPTRARSYSPPISSVSGPRTGGKCSPIGTPEASEPLSGGQTAAGGAAATA